MALAQWHGRRPQHRDHEADIREGGVWRFDMMRVLKGKQQRFPNLVGFLEIVPN